MLRKIKLYGKLAKFIGHRVLEADVATAAEAVRFLLANWPELESHMSEQHYRVTVGTYDLGLEELHDPAGAAPISFVPVVSGAGAAGRIILGAALIVGAFFTGGATIGLLGLAAPIAVSTVLLGIGASLVLGGVSQLLTPVPKISQGASNFASRSGASSSSGGTGKDSDDDPRKSYSFSGIQNTSRQGVPVPIIYGEVIVGAVTISAGIDTVQVAA
jgi:predicted phage tail protein